MRATRRILKPTWDSWWGCRPFRGASPLLQVLRFVHTCRSGLAPRKALQPITTWGKNRELSLVINESSSRMPIPDALPPTTHEPIRV